MDPQPRHRLRQGQAEGRRGMSRKRSVWKNTPEGRTVRRNITAEHFTSRPVELLESPALRVLSRHAHLVLMRVELELRRHAGRANGKLIVTTEQFIEYGVERRRIPAALRELEALGILGIIHGRGGNAEHRKPNLFLVNYLCGAVESRDEITNTWRRIESLEQAKQIVRDARGAKDANRVAYGRRTAGRKKHFPGTKSVPGPRYQNGTISADFPGTKTVPPGPGTKTVPPIDISGGGGEAAVKSSQYTSVHGIGHNAGPPLTAEPPTPDERPVWSTPVLTEIPYTDELRRLYAATEPLPVQTLTEIPDDGLNIPTFLRRN
jgi:hypothetical protein